MECIVITDEAKSFQRLQENGLESLLAMSRLWLSWSEQWAESTLAASRDALRGAAQLAQAFAPGTPAEGLRNWPARQLDPMTDRIIAHGRGLRDLTLRTQEEFARIVQDGCSLITASLPADGGWPALRAPVAPTGASAPPVPAVRERASRRKRA